MNISLPNSVWTVITAIALAGCSSSNLPPGAAAVEGTVTFEGSPVEGATVMFRSESGFAAVGKTNAEGRYQLNSSQIPGGAKPGQYNVTVVKREEVEGTSLTEDDPNYKPNAMQNSTASRKHLLPEKYSRPGTTDLKADIQEGTNQVDLELKKP